MQIERFIEKNKLFDIINYLKENNIDNGTILRTKTSRSTKKSIKLVYYNYLDLYIVEEQYFTNQLKAINYFNKQ